MKKNKTLPEAWQGLYRRTVKQIELLTPDEITRMSWARAVESAAALPDVYRPYVEAQTGEGAPFPVCVLTPTFQGFLRQENEKLVFQAGRRIHVVERARERPLALSFALQDIDRMELGVVLLKAWLTICGRDDQGKPNAVTLRFNAVTEKLFSPLIESFRCAQARPGGGADAASEAAERARFDPLERRSFKFMNYARRSLQPGEHVQGYVLQPEMRRPALSLMGRPILHRVLSPAHLCILTDRELILIRDDLESLKGCDDGRYGGVWNFIPLAHIRAIELNADRFGNPQLAVNLRSGGRVESLFHPAQRAALHALLENQEGIQT